MARADLAKDPAEVAAMFDEVAKRYDITNDLLAVGQTRLWRRAVVKAVAPRPGERILDLAAGTGTSSAPLAARGALVVPCDFSLGMLGVGRLREPSLPFVAGDALRLPFQDASFDAVTISFGLRNTADPAAALAEIHRVTTRPWTLMEVCGGQTHTIVKQGIDEALPEGVRMIHGPGCPVCVTPLEQVDKALARPLGPSAPCTPATSWGRSPRWPGVRRPILMPTSIWPNPSGRGLINRVWLISWVTPAGATWPG